MTPFEECWLILIPFGFTIHNFVNFVAILLVVVIQFFEVDFLLACLYSFQLEILIRLFNDVDDDRSGSS